MVLLATVDVVDAAVADGALVTVVIDAGALGEAARVAGPRFPRSGFGIDVRPATAGTDRAFEGFVEAAVVIGTWPDPGTSDNKSPPQGRYYGSREFHSG